MPRCHIFAIRIGEQSILENSRPGAGISQIMRCHNYAARVLRFQGRAITNSKFAATAQA
jgi:hypothetical protein